MLKAFENPEKYHKRAIFLRNFRLSFQSFISTIPPEVRIEMKNI